MVVTSLWRSPWGLEPSTGHLLCFPAGHRVTRVKAGGRCLSARTSPGQRSAARRVMVGKIPCWPLVSWDSVNLLIMETPIISGDCLSQPICPSSHKHLSHRPSCSSVAITHPLPNPQALRPRIKLFGGISSREETCYHHGNCYRPLWAACTSVQATGLCCSWAAWRRLYCWLGLL